MAAWKQKKKGRRKILAAGIIFAALLLFLTAIGIFSINQVEVEGNEHYTKEEIEELIIESRYDHNSLYLYWKYNYTDTKNIPFIDTVEVDMLSSHKVRITVYEKNVVGYIEYLESYMYFDKDGILVESSTRKIEGVPLITGLSFNHLVLHEELPVQDKKVFKTILNLTQLLKKHEITPDKIYFDKNLNMTLYFEKIKVLLGEDEGTDEKIARLQYLFPELIGLEGSLYMENYNEDSKNITFQKE